MYTVLTNEIGCLIHACVITHWNVQCKCNPIAFTCQSNILHNEIPF